MNSKEELRAQLIRRRDEAKRRLESLQAAFASGLAKQEEVKAAHNDLDAAEDAFSGLYEKAPNFVIVTRPRSLSRGTENTNVDPFLEAPRY